MWSTLFCALDIAIFLPMGPLEISSVINKCYYFSVTLCHAKIKLQKGRHHLLSSMYNWPHIWLKRRRHHHHHQSSSSSLSLSPPSSSLSLLSSSSSSSSHHLYYRIMKNCLFISWIIISNVIAYLDVCLMVGCHTTTKK